MPNERQSRMKRIENENERMQLLTGLRLRAGTAPPLPLHPPEDAVTSACKRLLAPFRPLQPADKPHQPAAATQMGIWPACHCEKMRLVFFHASLERMFFRRA